jgi:deoxyxylulose-5-phosphate synthase
MYRKERVDRILSILKENGISCGIILCEYISPYSDLADEIFKLVEGYNVKTITFVEEEIRAGGFGMMLSDIMRNKGYLDGIKYTVMAADDAFIRRDRGQSYLCAAGLDAEHIAQTIKQINN